MNFEEVVKEMNSFVKNGYLDNEDDGMYASPDGGVQFILSDEGIEITSDDWEDGVSYDYTEVKAIGVDTSNEDSIYFAVIDNYYNAKVFDITY